MCAQRDKHAEREREEGGMIHKRNMKREDVIDGKEIRVELAQPVSRRWYSIR